MNERDLRDGKTYTFSNDDYSAEVTYGKTQGGGTAFKIWFNGKYVKITKTFKPIDKKINQLIEDYNLIETKLLEKERAASDIMLSAIRKSNRGGIGKQSSNVIFPVHKKP